MKKILFFLCFISITLFAQKDKINFEIDHVSIVVKDLKEAEYFVNDKLGFATKPGSLHENSIHNFFIKFPDKSYIEFVTASKAKDNLSKYFLELTKEFPGGTPLFLFLRINTGKEFIQLERNILQSGIETIKDDLGYAKLISFDDDDLYNINIIYYTSSVQDLPKYFEHETSAKSLYSVWIDINNSGLLIKKLKLLGLDIKEVNQLPLSDFRGHKVELNKKPIYLSQFPNDNFIYGITIKVESINRAMTHLTNKTNYAYDLYISSRGSRTLLNPRTSFGMWIELLENK